VTTRAASACPANVIALAAELNTHECSLPLDPIMVFCDD
jgi:hypothetical protein